ncbi:MAG: phosphoenolpyruvate-protein phosphotransferase PtsP, partial [Gammaproteobacteria bacterium]|nr:phosphoenolpyruvate-protein phosphotransferase PtsP [Gammaproteobacteria bacterium]
RAIELIVDGAHRYGRQVSVCGEMAEDPVAVLMLIGLGVDRLSVSAASVARIKHVIRRANRQNAVDLLQEMYRQDDAGTIRFLLAGAIEELGLGGLVRAGR